MRIDRSDDGGEQPDAAEPPGVREVKDTPVRDAAANRDGAGRDVDGSAARVARNLEYRATVDAANRSYAIDQGCARVRESGPRCLPIALRSSTPISPRSWRRNSPNR